MKQLYQPGESVEVFELTESRPGKWYPGTVRRVVRMSTVEGRRSYSYEVEYDGGFAEFVWMFDQDRVRRPGENKHTARVFTPPKVKKKPRPLRAHNLKGKL